MFPGRSCFWVFSPRFSSRSTFPPSPLQEHILCLPSHSGRRGRREVVKELDLSAPRRSGNPVAGRGRHVTPGGRGLGRSSEAAKCPLTDPDKSPQCDGRDCRRRTGETYKDNRGTTVSLRPATSCATTGGHGCGDGRPCFRLPRSVQSHGLDRLRLVAETHSNPTCVALVSPGHSDFVVE